MSRRVKRGGGGRGRVRGLSQCEREVLTELRDDLPAGYGNVDVREYLRQLALLPHRDWESDEAHISKAPKQFLDYLATSLDTNEDIFGNLKNKPIYDEARWRLGTALRKIRRC